MQCGPRILCIWFPQWPLQRLAAARAELRSGPVLLYQVQARGGGLKVTAYAARLGSLLTSPPAAAGRKAAAGRARAASAGIRPGMPLAEALALHEFSQLEFSAPKGKSPAAELPALHLEAHDPWADRLALVELAAVCQQLGPTVGLEDSPRPESLLVDITGVAELFGGERQLAERGLALLAERGFAARLAVADTLGAAWAVARSQAEAIALVPPGAAAPYVAELPIAALRLPPETLELLGQLGIRMIGEVDRLPREGLLGRFGPDCLQRLDQACGRLAEVISAEHLPGEHAAEWLLEHPTERRDAIETILEQLLPRVIEPLAAQRLGAVELVCRLECPGEAARQLVLRSFRPCAAVGHWLDMFRLRLESVWIRRPVAAVRLAATAWDWLELAQQELFAAAERGGEYGLRGGRELAALVDRLTSRLGRQAVLRPELLADAQPEHACQYLPLGDARPSQLPRRQFSSQRRQSAKPRQAAASERPGTPPLSSHERPLRLCQPPIELAVLAVVPDGPPLRFRWAGAEEQVARFWGPERIETGWWRSRCVRRDYYRVETAAGQRFWLFRRLGDGHWFLHGTFD